MPMCSFLPMKSYDAHGYCAIGSLILEYCLADRGIKAELVKGYAVIGDTYYTLHIWNKIYLPKGTHQIDIVHTMKEIPFKVEYTFVVKDKWKSTIDTEKEQLEHDDLVKFFSRYQEHGRESALEYLAENRDRSTECGKMS